MKTENLRVDFGRHDGELYTRVPVQYLKWMVNSNHSKAAIAEAELKRRGTVTPTLDISGHAIDRASLRLLDNWKRTAHKDEGLNAWLIRVSQEALKIGARKGDAILYADLKFVFEMDGRWPVLKTIM